MIKFDPFDRQRYQWIPKEQGGVCCIGFGRGWGGCVEELLYTLIMVLIALVTFWSEFY